MVYVSIAGFIISVFLVFLAKGKWSDIIENIGFKICVVSLFIFLVFSVIWVIGQNNYSSVVNSQRIYPVKIENLSTEGATIIYLDHSILKTANYSGPVKVGQDAEITTCCRKAPSFNYGDIRQF
jgi:hypothetical protein